MAQAAFCSQCGSNVYVTEDGRCPNGHGPESLSNFYDVPDQEAPADTAGETQVTETPRSPVDEIPYTPPPTDYSAPTPADVAVA